MRSNQTLKYLAYFIKHIPQLKEKEKKILFERLKETTLSKIGESFNLTEGRIRQIEKEAIAKIKSKIQQLPLFK
ncbi:MAG: sigma factor-like helix-turn-helix DNA-binding protein [bacterium]